VAVDLRDVATRRVSGPFSVYRHLGPTAWGQSGVTRPRAKGSGGREALGYGQR